MNWHAIWAASTDWLTDWRPLFQSAEERSLWLEHDQRGYVTDEEFFERFYANTGMPLEVPRRLRELYAQQLGMKKVEPQDNAVVFAGELDFYEFLLEVDEAFRTKTAEREIEIGRTFDAVAWEVARQLEAVAMRNNNHERQAT